MKNLKKKVDYLKDQMDSNGANGGDHTDSDEDEDEDEEVEQPKKKNIKAQRAAVSAEVYGTWNKKGDFKPKVVPKG